MKLFQNLTSGFREDLLEICSCPYSESRPHLLQPRLMTDQNFATIFEEGQSRNISDYFKIWPAVSEKKIF